MSTSALLKSAGATTMTWSTAASGGDLASNNIFVSGQWAMWCGTYAGGSTSATSSIYYNGNLDNSATKTGVVSGSSTIAVGLAGSFSTSTVGPTLFYNRALTATEVRLIFQAYRTSFGL
jgi:hypothetical protein